MKHFTIPFVIITFLFIHISVFSENEVNASQLYPEKFDLRDYGLVSEVSDQGEYNTCWAFSALGSVETQLLKRGLNYKLSSWQLAYSSYIGNNRFPMRSDDPFTEGGSSIIAAAVLSRWGAPVSENDVPYNSQISPSTNIPPAMCQVNDIYNITPWISKKKKHDISYIKEFLYTRNSVSSTCSLNTAYLNDETAALYCSDSSYNYKNDDCYHSILLIGWDDNYPRENFNSEQPPEKDGAWLAKNSWGTNWGNKGFFWISYEDHSLLEAVVYSSDLETKFQSNYFYDNFGWSTSLSSNILLEMSGVHVPQTTTGYMANVFVAEKDEYISAVSFYTVEENADYEICVCTNLKDKTDPVSGILSSVTSGNEKYPGYHTIPLETKIKINESERFSVIVKIINPTSVYTIPIDASIQIYPLLNRKIQSNQYSLFNIEPSFIMANSFKNESFISYDGSKWHDLYRKSMIPTDPESKIHIAPDMPDDELLKIIYPGNVCVKAFTTPYYTQNGDINCDGVITAADVTKLVDFILKAEAPSPSVLQSADMDQSGLINTADLIILIKLIILS